MKLDHNLIGAPGMKNLAKGLCSNKTLKSLSLTFCGIDEKGADSLFQVIIY